MTRLARKRRHTLRRILLGLTLSTGALCASGAQAQVAGVAGGTVVGGAANITNAGTTLDVTTLSDRTIINWDGFSIGSGETANFFQPNASSSVLNRVTTPNNPSAIHGALNSNGNVLLINPSGILVGPTGVINTNGFTASVLDIPNADFIEGEGPLRFQGESTASVINEGTINTGAGGAALIGGSVINSGQITSTGGAISLVTGGSVTLADGSRYTQADIATIQNGISPYAGVIQNRGTIRATGAVESGGEVYLVNPGGKILHDGTLEAVSAAMHGKTVDLDADIAAAEISGTASTVNVLGSDGGAELQDAVDVSAAGATVNVAAGSYSSFVADVEDLTVAGAGDSTVVNAASPAVTIAANGVTVQDMTLQGTGNPDDVGVLLDGTAVTNLTGAEIINVDFSNLDDGVRSQGDIGDGVAANVDVTIRGNSNTDRSVLEDFSGSAIDVGDTDGDAVYVVRDIVIQDGSDANSVSTSAAGIAFGAIGAATIQGVSISGTNTDGIEFAAQSAAEILVGGADAVDANSIEAGDDGIDFLGISGGTVTIAGNTIIRGAGGLGDGLEFAAIDGEATVNVVGNTEISGQTDGVEFQDSIDTSSVTFAGNASIAGDSGDGILFVAPMNDSIVVIGDATVTVEGNAANFSGNMITGVDGLDIDTINGGSVSIRNNTSIAGTDDGIEFDDDILNDAQIVISGNSIAGSGNGIHVIGELQGDSNLAISNNSIGTTTAKIGANGIDVFGGISDTSTVTIENNQVFADGRAIRVNDLQSPSTLSITGGTYNGTGGALLVDNRGVAGTDGRLNIGSANYIAGAGANVIEVLTDAGNAGVDIDFAGSATIDGGATGLRLSGPGIDILGDTLGTIALNGQTTHYIELANGAEFAPGNPTVIDAKGVTFDGFTGAGMTPAQLYATEDMMVHFPDDNSLGLIDIATLFAVEGESIQTAVNAAGGMAGPQTVVVGAGTFGGSVEVWVDDLSLVGLGDQTIIGTDAVDPFANNGDRNNGFEVVRRSFTAGLFGTVADVTIDGFTFDTVASSGSNTGIVLGGNLLRQTSGTTIQNSNFNDLNDGIVANAILETTTISGNEMTDIDSQGIDIRPTLLGQTVVIEDNNIASDQESVRFFRSVNLADVTIQGNELASDDNNAIRFRSSVNGSNVLIGGLSAGDGNALSGDDEAIHLDSTLTASQLAILGNESIEGGDAGIKIDSTVSLSQVSIIGNGRITALGPAIFFDGSVNDSRVDVSSNGVIGSLFDDAIAFDNPINDSIVNIGATLIDLGDGLQFFIGNGIVGGGDDAINVDEINESLFTVTLNGLLLGNAGSGIEFDDTVNESLVIVGVNGRIEGDDAGVEFDTNINESVVAIVSNGQIVSDGAAIQFRDDIDDSIVSIGGLLPLVGNGTISGGSAGVEFQSGVAIDESIVRIVGNDTIEATNGGGDAIQFDSGSSIEDSLLSIARNDSIMGAARGIEVRATIEDSLVSIRNNRIEGVSSDAILLDDQITDSTVVIGGPFGINGNEIVGGAEGIDIGPIDGGRVVVRNNAVMANGEAVEFDGTISGDALVRVTENQIEGASGVVQTASVVDDALFEVTDNQIVVTNAASGQGIQLNNLDSSQAALLRDNVIDGGAIGVAVQQSSGVRDGAVVVDGVEVNGASDTGMLFANTTGVGSLEVTLQNEVTINGGATANDNGLAFDGLGLSLTGDTLADTRFVGTNGNFVELRNGALFEPGRPTLIDGTNVFWDGLDAAIDGERAQIIAKIVDFLDDPTLGLIFPGAGLPDEQTYDRFTRYQDWFRTVGTLLENHQGTIKVPAPTVTNELDDEEAGQ